MAGNNTAGGKDDYFKAPNPFMLLVATVAMALLTAMGFAPSLIPYSYLGPVGALSHYLVTSVPAVCYWAAILTWTVHLFEAFYASILCKSKNLSSEATTKWVCFVFVYGVFSLSILKAYKGKDKAN